MDKKYRTIITEFNTQISFKKSQVNMFPAYAGLIPMQASIREEDANVPRIRGVDSKYLSEFVRTTGCSPHTRG